MTETMHSSAKKGGLVFRVLLPIVIVLAGVGAFAALVMTQKPPQKVGTPYLGPLVESISAPEHSRQVVVTGSGAVRPAVEIDLVPQVSGIVVWKSPNLESGGFVNAGDLLVQIDPRDYELAVQAAEAERAQAAYGREIAVGEANAARAEWALVSAEQAEAGEPGLVAEPLVLHVPQLEAAKAQLLSAKARIEEARLRLGRTKLHAPFDGRVRQTSLDQAQYVQAGQAIARLYSIHKAEIVVPLPDEDLQWIGLPMPGPAPAVEAAAATNTGTPVHGRGGERHQSGDHEAWPQATVSAEYAGHSYEWTGRVVRCEAELDPQSRMAHLVVEVARSHVAADGVSEEGHEVPLVGLFVDVAIHGRTVDGVRVIPRAALRPEGVVWTAGADGVLRMRPVELIRKGTDDALVRVEMEADDRVIVSRLKGATDGMKVRLHESTGEGRQ